MVEFGSAVPVSLVVLKVVNLGLDELVPDLPECREVRNVCLEHEKDHSSLG